MDILSKFTAPVMVFTATTFFGFWLSRRGKPCNGFLSSVHKLTALGAAILFARAPYRAPAGIAPLGWNIFMLVIALFASGALMSAAGGSTG
jgi:hypothetical protein